MGSIAGTTDADAETMDQTAIGTVVSPHARLCMRPRTINGDERARDQRQGTVDWQSYPWPWLKVLCSARTEASKTLKIYTRYMVAEHGL